MRRAVLMICDGLRADLVQPEFCPDISALQAEGTRFLRHRAIFPSVTRTSAASIATGCRPGGHGLHGNTMALPEGKGFTVHNVGPPEFLSTMRQVLGRTLRVPVLAERVKALGDAVLYSNVSPGAAYFFDPEGGGYVYHRAGSYGPGRQAVAEPLVVSHDTAGDLAMTARFCAEALSPGQEAAAPPLAVLWLANPDKTMHGCALGSPTHRQALEAVEACVRQVAEAVAKLRDAGEEVLFLLGSDHGQETVRRVVPVERLMTESGFKDGLDPAHLVVSPQGTSALVYAAETVPEERVDSLADWLAGQDWCGTLWVGEALSEVGLAERDGLRLAFSMAKSDETNCHGIAGLSDAAVRFDEAEQPPGLGQHGGTGAFESSPFLIAMGSDFAPDRRVRSETSLVDIAPTVLRHLGLSAEDLQGRALQPIAQAAQLGTSKIQNAT